MITISKRINEGAYNALGFLAAVCDRKPDYNWQRKPYDDLIMFERVDGRVYGIATDGRRLHIVPFLATAKLLEDVSEGFFMARVTKEKAVLKPATHGETFPKWQSIVPLKDVLHETVEKKSEWHQLHKFPGGVHIKGMSDIVYAFARINISIDGRFLMDINEPVGEGFWYIWQKNTISDYKAHPKGWESLADSELLSNGIYKLYNIFASPIMFKYLPHMVHAFTKGETMPPVAIIMPKTGDAEDELQHELATPKGYDKVVAKVANPTFPQLTPKRISQKINELYWFRAKQQGGF